MSPKSTNFSRLLVGTNNFAFFLEVLTGLRFEPFFFTDLFFLVPALTGRLRPEEPFEELVFFRTAVVGFFFLATRQLLSCHLFYYIIVSANPQATRRN